MSATSCGDTSPSWGASRWRNQAIEITGKVDIFIRSAGNARAHESGREAGEHLAGENVQVTVDLGVGRGEATVWTCDLSEEYVKENAGELS